MHKHGPEGLWLVVMKCSNPLLVKGWVKLGVVISGNSVSNVSNQLVKLDRAWRWGAGVLVKLSGEE